MVALQPRRLIRESVPIAAILLFWNLLAGVAHFQNVGGPVGSAGVVMAALYVVVRGVSLSSEVLPPVTGDVRKILYENAQLAVPAGAWFLGAMGVGAVETYVYEFTWVISSVKTALAGAGLGVVAIYAVAAGYRTLDGGRAAGGRPPAGRGTSGDERTGSDRGTESDGTSADD